MTNGTPQIKGEDTMTSTPLLDRIDARRANARPKTLTSVPMAITERMSPFMRRLAEKNLPVADKSSFIRGAFVPNGDGGAA